RGSSSFFTLYGFNSKLSANPLSYPIPIYANPTQQHYQVAENLNKAKLSQLHQVNKNRRPAPRHNVGDLVLLSTKNLPFSKSKLEFRWIGPVKITQVSEWTQAYTLDLTEYPELSNIQNKLHNSL